MSITTAACSALSVVIWALDRNREPLHNPVTIPWIAWMSAMVLSAAFALDPSASFARLGKGLFPGLVAIGAWHGAGPEHRRGALLCLLVSATTAWFYGLGVFVFQGGVSPRGRAGWLVTT